MSLTISHAAVVHHTFVIERIYPVSPERVFAAFASTAQKRRWFAEGKEHEVERFDMEFQVGGAEHASYRLGKGSPFPGAVLASEGVFQDIVPNSRIVCASRMTFAGRPISVALLTFELVPTDKGTSLIFTHQAAFFEGADGPQMREGGWRTLLDRLSDEVSR